MYFPFATAAAAPPMCGPAFHPHEVMMTLPPSFAVGLPHQQTVFVAPPPTLPGVVHGPHVCFEQHGIADGRREPFAHLQKQPPDPSLHHFSGIFPEWEVDELDFEDACTRMRDGARRAGITANRRSTRDQSSQCVIAPARVEAPVPRPEVEKQEDEVSRVVGNINISGVVKLEPTGEESEVQADRAESVLETDFDRYETYRRPLCRPWYERQDNWSRYDLQLKRFQRWLQQQQRPLLERIPKHREAFPQRLACANPTSDAMQARIRRVYDHAHHTRLNPDDSYVYQFLDARRARHADAFAGVNTTSGRRRYDRPPPVEPHVPYDPSQRRAPGFHALTRSGCAAEHAHGARRRAVSANSVRDPMAARVRCASVQGPQPAAFHAELEAHGRGRTVRQRVGTSARTLRPSLTGGGDDLEQHTEFTGSLRAVDDEKGTSLTGSFVVPLATDEGRRKVRDGTPPPWRARN
ncbi:hypothetical protein BESB_079120 [Besnoitia besnoiti]|uniref:Uncharacterized protein n=1 Tax=Besnoitia besnoiti TaxID=94643 RepID=A0A2A9MCN8_BESBE|nr:hypothetical protein BESB_079120 [Besnoitia besnoiti]PFH33696.1 hypothetical protein BESB_079120 [Besnoitia besnoiti]